MSRQLNISARQVIARYVDKDEDGEQIFNRLPCPFLLEKKCSVYDSRPSDCRSYPHLHKENFTSRMIGVVNSNSICPIVFNVHEALKRQFRSDFEDFKDEFDKFG